jgi:hypothetical protein
MLDANARASSLNEQQFHTNFDENFNNNEESYREFQEISSQTLNNLNTVVIP